MRRGQRLVGALWRWHRRIGLLAALFVFVLASTGIALNHSPGLALDQSYVQSAWLLRVYGDSATPGDGYRLDGGWVSQSRGGHIYLDAREVTTCYGELVGAAQTSEVIVAACSDQLVLILPGGELVETITASAGLPTPLDGMGESARGLAVQREGRWYAADLDALDFDTLLDAGSTVAQHAPGPLPKPIRAALPVRDQWLTWERVLLDLHSGRLLGSAGVWLMDAAALLLICLASSGVLMWVLHRLPRGRR